MTDDECAQFLRWALPRMRLRWDGFRNLRRQVGKRITRRQRALGLPDVAAYRSYLERRPEEWAILRKLCRVTISRFYRDRGVFRALETQVLPRLGQDARRERRGVAVWCAGSAGGEEAYTLALIWRLKVVTAVGDVRMRLLGTDVDDEELGRARRGVYPPGALKELPLELLEPGFEDVDGQFRLRDRFREGIEFRRSDLVEETPEGHFDLVLCRNLAFTYFDEALQVETARRLASRMTPRGVLVVGKHEGVPEHVGLVPVSVPHGLYAQVTDDLEPCDE